MPVFDDAGTDTSVTEQVGATAQLYLPVSFGRVVAEDGKTVFRDGSFVPGVVAGVAKGQELPQESAFVFELQAGSYKFVVK